MSGYDYSQEVANQLLEDSDKQIEQLQAKIAELEEAAQDVQTLSAECFTLHERIAELKKERDVTTKFAQSEIEEQVAKLSYLRHELAARDLVIQQMHCIFEQINKFDVSGTKWMLDLRSISREALSIQPTTSALDAYVAEKVKEEREECAKECEEGWCGRGDDFANAIRARSDKENVN